MGWANTAALAFLLSNVESSALEHNVEVHTVDTSGRIVLKTEIDMLVDTEAEVALRRVFTSKKADERAEQDETGNHMWRIQVDGITRRREVLGRDLVVSDLEATLDEVDGLVATDGNVTGDLLVTTDTEGTDSVAS